jgi:hypothetical protein
MTPPIPPRSAPEPSPLWFRRFRWRTGTVLEGVRSSQGASIPSFRIRSGAHHVGYFPTEQGS